MVLFKMRDSVHSVRYSPVCNVLRLWRIWLIPTYRVYVYAYAGTQTNLEIAENLWYAFSNYVNYTVIIIL